MELRVETADGSSLPKGCFVSVRVGDVQKQRRYETKGAFQFPAPAHTRKAKIDLYMHVGTCSVSVGPEDKTSEVSVQALEPNAPRPCLKVVSSLKEEAAVDRETKMSNVKREAVEYLSKWLIQERLGEAVKALLQKRPDDPIDFICGFLRSNSGVQPEPMKKPAEPPACQPEALPVIPFKPYYKLYIVPSARASFPSIYAKFPAPKRKALPVMPFRPYYTHYVVPSARSFFPSVYAKFPSPKKESASEMNQVRVKARAALESAFLQESAQKQAGAPPQGFGAYCQQHLQAMPESAFCALWNKFGGKAAERKPQAAPQKAAACPAVAGPSFKVMPSVGSWLKPRPCQLILPKGELPTHLKASWDLQGLRPACCASTGELLEVERAVTNALLELSGELEGEYLPLPGSMSYPARPGGMSEAERKILFTSGLLLEANESHGRGVFVNAKRDVVVWVNGKHHVQLIVKQEAISAQEGVMRLRAVEKALSQALSQEGHDLARPKAASSRRLTGLRAPGALSVDERCEVERVITRAFLELSSDLEGEYFPLASSMSYPPRPGGMSPEEECALSGNGVIIGSSDAAGRGVFTTNAGDLAVVVNGENHVEFLTRCPCMSAGCAKARIECIEAAVRDAIRQSGYDFA